MKIGIIGVGVVGSAIRRYYAEKGGFEVLAYDRDPARSTHAFDELKDCSIIFVSVPTLTKDNGSQDLMPLMTVIQNLSTMKYRGVVVHKCTVVPGTTRFFQSQYPKIRLVHCPEFLTERNAFNDYKHAGAVMLSGYPGDTDFVSEIMDHTVVHAYPEFETTEIAKYVHNCFLATKVSFFNEMLDVCRHFGVSYDEMIDGLKWMGGIGTGHLKVPGPDGKRGFGGMCFPKDTQAFINHMSTKGIWLEVLAGAIKVNKKVRGE
jgi:UDPglucose 6-dehydrogenase